MSVRDRVDLVAHRCDTGRATYTPVGSTGLIVCGGTKPYSWVNAGGRSHGVSFGWDDGLTTTSHLQWPEQDVPVGTSSGTSRWRGT